MENEINNELEDAKRICEKNGYEVILKTKEIIPLTESQIKNEGIDGIIRRVAKNSKLTESELVGRTRIRYVVEPRQLSHFLARKYTDLSLASIAWSIGRLNHATVLNSIKIIDNLLDSDKPFNRRHRNIKILYSLD